MRAQKRQEKLGVYAGSFDPLTVGHLWMIEQGARLFDRLTVAVGVNPDQKYTFPQEERLVMLRESTKQFDNVSVASFSNLWRRVSAAAGDPQPISGVRRTKVFLIRPLHVSERRFTAPRFLTG